TAPRADRRVRRAGPRPAAHTGDRSGGTGRGRGSTVVLLHALRREPVVRAVRHSRLSAQPSASRASSAHHPPSRNLPMSIPAELLEEEVRPNRLPDTEWLSQFRASGDRRKPILLSLGERWEGIPPALVTALASVPPSAHGYQLSMYGLPRLRRILRDYIRDTHRLGGLDDRYEVAVSWTGTRSVMRDFAEMLAPRFGDGPPPLALAVAPAWDYAG